jgi:hypothetical protein
MEKIAIFLIALMMVSVGFLSGCNETKNNGNNQNNGRYFSGQLVANNFTTGVGKNKTKGESLALFEIEGEKYDGNFSNHYYYLLDSNNKTIRNLSSLDVFGYSFKNLEAVKIFGRNLTQGYSEFIIIENITSLFPECRNDDVKFYGEWEAYNGSFAIGFVSDKIYYTNITFLENKTYIYETSTQSHTSGEWNCINCYLFIDERYYPYEFSNDNSTLTIFSGNNATTFQKIS